MSTMHAANLCATAAAGVETRSRPLPQPVYRKSRLAVSSREWRQADSCMFRGTHGRDPRAAGSTGGAPGDRRPLARRSARVADAGADLRFVRRLGGGAVSAGVRAQRAQAVPTRAVGALGRRARRTTACHAAHQVVLPVRLCHSTRAAVTVASGERVVDRCVSGGGSYAGIAGTRWHGSSWAATT